MYEIPFFCMGIASVFIFSQQKHIMVSDVFPKIFRLLVETGMPYSPIITSLTGDNVKCSAVDDRSKA